MWDSSPEGKKQALRETGLIVGRSIVLKHPRNTKMEEEMIFHAKGNVVLIDKPIHSGVGISFPSTNLRSVSENWTDIALMDLEKMSLYSGIQLYGRKQ